MHGCQEDAAFAVHGLQLLCWRLPASRHALRPPPPPPSLHLKPSKTGGWEMGGWRARCGRGPTTPASSSALAKPSAVTIAASWPLRASAHTNSAPTSMAGAAAAAAAGAGGKDGSGAATCWSSACMSAWLYRPPCKLTRASERYECTSAALSASRCAASATAAASSTASTPTLLALPPVAACASAAGSAVASGTCCANGC